MQVKKSKKKEEKFMRELYDKAYKELDELKVTIDNDKEEILKLIGYAIVIFDLDNDYKKAERFIAIAVMNMLTKEEELIEDFLDNGLLEILNDVCDFYGFELLEYEKKEIRDRVFKGMTYLERQRKNTSFTKEKMKKLSKDVSGGKMKFNSTSIKRRVSNDMTVHFNKIFGLYESEITRVRNTVFLLWNINKRVRYHSVLEKNTCADCSDLDGIVFDAKEAFDIIPQHTRCKCYWTLVEDGENI